ncbi:MAG TPA: hypothetical protein VGJ54_08305 [Streptosporangiaceae bacterium]|jgi:fatty-acid desaturase|nr:hypothetical protein [Streptosporangiaceae bacterium]
MLQHVIWPVNSLSHVFGTARLGAHRRTPGNHAQPQRVLQPAGR